MPTSSYTQIGKIIEVVLLLRPHSILDVGFGNGKYGFLAREYLELWAPRGAELGQRRVTVDGIEGFSPFIGEIQRAIYDNIIVAEALAATRAITKTYDLVLLIDVLEHFDRVQGREVLEQCSRLGRNVLVSTPKRVETQDAEFGNPLQVHRSQWSPRTIGLGRMRLAVKERNSYLVLLGEDAKKVGRWLLYRRVERVSRPLAKVGLGLFRFARVMSRYCSRIGTGN